jgi:hypothetical protein
MCVFRLRAASQLRLEKDRERDLKLRLVAARGRAAAAYRLRRALQRARRAAKEALGDELDQDEEADAAAQAEAAQATADADAAAGGFTVNPSTHLQSLALGSFSAGAAFSAGALAAVSLGSDGSGGSGAGEGETDGLSLRHARKEARELHRLGPLGARAAAEPPAPWLLEAAAAEAARVAGRAAAALEATSAARAQAAAEAAACDPAAVSARGHPEARALPSPQQLAGWLRGCSEAPRPRYETPAHAVHRTPFLQALAATMDRRRKFDPNNLADSIATLHHANATAKTRAEVQTPSQMPLQ